jgi:amidohydrolase
MIRADMDALPLTEATGLDFASTHDGAMHACGHDGHMAMVLGAATVLNRSKEHLKGNIKFLFQPAEEGPGGAKPMIEEGVMEDPRVDFSTGCHVWPGIAEGTIGVKAGPLMAAMDRFDIKIIGQGGHGAMPHLCVDALEVGTQVVSALQRLEKIIRGICDSAGAAYELKYTQGYPPLHNDAQMADLVQKCAELVVGRDRVIEPEPTMGGEDMAFYLERSKGCFFFLGVGREGGAPIHNPEFDFNEDVLLLGVETYCRIAEKVLA